MTSGFGMSSMTLTSCHTHSVQHCSAITNTFCRAALAAQTRSVPNIALRAPLLHGHRMPHGVLVGLVGLSPPLIFHNRTTRHVSCIKPRIVSPLVWLIP